MKFFVTGGLGVIGSRFAEIALKAGHEVTILDSCEEPRNTWMIEQLQVYEKVKIFRGRLEDAPIRALIAGHDLILHASAHTGIPHSELTPDDDWASNVDATRNLLEAMRIGDENIPTIITSSVKPYKISQVPVYASHKRTVWKIPGVDENFPLEPDEPYAASKMAQSALGVAYAKSYNLPIVVLRCSNLYGDAPCHGPRHGWLTWFCIAAVIGRTIELQGSGKQTRDMLFSDDVAAAVMASFTNMSAMSGSIYNIGGGPKNTVSCLEAIEIIETILGHPVAASSGPGRKNEDQLFVTNFSKFHEATGWAPRVNIEDGISRILYWATAHKDELKEIYAEA